MMTSKKSTTAHLCVNNAYDQNFLSELSLGDGASKILEMGTGITDADHLSVAHFELPEAQEKLSLDFPDNSFDGIALKGQLFQMSDPLHFFDEALRVLKPGGRLAMLEPAISLTSWGYYKYLSGYDVDMSINPFTQKPVIPFQTSRAHNIAYPTALFTRQEHRIQFMERFPGFRLTKRKWVGMIADPLSLGAKPYSLIPAFAVPLTLEIEEILNPFVGRWLSNKMLITLEKQ